MKKKGICFVCGCTFEDPCLNSNGATCGWANVGKPICTICTVCEPLNENERKKRRTAGINRLTAIKADVILRLEVLRSEVKPAKKVGAKG